MTCLGPEMCLGPCGNGPPRHDRHRALAYPRLDGSELAALRAGALVSLTQQLVTYLGHR